MAILHGRVALHHQGMAEPMIWQVVSAYLLMGITTLFLAVILTNEIVLDDIPRGTINKGDDLLVVAMLVLVWPVIGMMLIERSKNARLSAA